MESPCAPCWEVVGGGDKGGIVVREGRTLASAKYPERLSTGALVRQLALEETRLNFEKVTGRGPSIGWVSVSIDSKTLLIRRSETTGVDEQPLTTLSSKLALEVASENDAQCKQGVLSSAFDTVDSLGCFNRDGFAIFREFLTARHLSECQDAFDSRMSRKGPGDEVDLGCNWGDATAAPFLRVLQDESFLDLAAEICGIPFVALRLELFGKEPGSSTEIPWHQDTFTTHVGFKWTAEKAADPTGCHPFTLWVAVDDVSLENGGMEMVPGRHREILTNNNGAVTESEIRFDLHKEYRMKAGQAGIHHPLTPHRSATNQTNRPRRAFLVRFAPWTARVAEKCALMLDGITRVSSQRCDAISSLPSGSYLWMPGNSETLSDGYHLNRFLICSRRHATPSKE